MSTKEAKARATAKFEKEHYKKMLIKFHKTHDSDILDKLDTVPSKQGYIKECIRKDIKEEEKE